MIEVGLVCGLVTCDDSDEISFLTSPYSTCMLHHDALQRVYDLGNRSILVLEQNREAPATPQVPQTNPPCRTCRTDFTIAWDDGRAVIRQYQQHEKG